MAANSARSVFVCTICKSFASRSYRSVLNHIGTIHTFGPSKEIHCGIDGCPASYKTENYNSFRSHVYRKHCDVLFLGGTSASGHETPQNGECSNDQPVDNDVDPNSDSDHQAVAGPDMKKAAALFLLKTLEERRITQVALDGIISDGQALMNVIFSHVQSGLSANGVELELSQIIDQQVLNPFDGLEKEFRRAKYYKEELGLIVSLLI